MEKCNIAFYCSSSKWGGIEINTVRYARWLKENGWSVKVFCVNGTKLQHNAVSQNLTIVSVFRSNHFWDFSAIFKTQKLFIKHQISFCIFRDMYDLKILFWAKIFSLGRLKLLHHQAAQFNTDRKGFFDSLLFRSISAWVCTLQYFADQVSTFTNYSVKKKSVIYIGVDQQRLLTYDCSMQQGRQHFHLANDAKVVGIIGRLDRNKGQHLAIEAIQILQNRDQNIHLLIVGESPLMGNYYEQELRMMTSEYELSNVVHFYRFTKKVELFYNAVDVVLHCGHGATFGTGIFEAMAFGKPVIGTNNAGTAELLGKNCGLLFQPDSADDLAEKILNLIEDKKLQQSIIENSNVKFALSYSKKASIKSLENIIYRLTKNEHVD